MRDVAAMLRSLDYAARLVLLDHPDDSQRAYRASEWVEHNADAFCNGYAAAAGRHPRDDAVLLRALVIEKAVYEVIYESRMRPQLDGAPDGRDRAARGMTADTTAVPPLDDDLRPSARRARRRPPLGAALAARRPPRAGRRHRTRAAAVGRGGRRRSSGPTATRSATCTKACGPACCRCPRCPTTGSRSTTATARSRADDPYRFLPTLGELDQHLIAEGRHEQLWSVLGAHVHDYAGYAGPVHGTSFAVWAPNAQGVRVVGDFNFWDGRGYPMRALGLDRRVGAVRPGAGRRCPVQVRDPRPGRRVAAEGRPDGARDRVPARDRLGGRPVDTHEWEDADWLAQRADARPAHRPDERLRGAPRLVAAGAVLPPARRRPRRLRQGLRLHPRRDAAGRRAPLRRARGATRSRPTTRPTARFGTPDDFRYLVDKLHQAGIGVHRRLGAGALPQGLLGAGPVRRHAAVRARATPRAASSPTGARFVFDFGRSEVRNFLVANAVYWLEEFHVDGLRVDAVASMLYLDYSRNPASGCPTRSAAGRTSKPSRSCRRSTPPSTSGSRAP